jgi:hypothetical protein
MQFRRGHGAWMGLHNPPCGQLLRNMDKLPERAEPPRFSGNPDTGIETQRVGQVARLFNLAQSRQRIAADLCIPLSTGAMFSTNREI